MEEYVDQLLTHALDCDLRELDFWEMTPGEVMRHIESKIRTRKLAAQERASSDYILASLIVKGFGLTMGSIKDDYPTIYEAYPGLFDDIAKSKEEEIQQQKISLSALRFKQFAQSYNNKFKNKEVPKKINE